jgi:hypothetical protein
MGEWVLSEDILLCSAREPPFRSVPSDDPNFSKIPFGVTEHRMGSYATLTPSRGRWVRGSPGPEAFETSLDTPKTQCSIGFQSVFRSYR